MKKAVLSIVFIVLVLSVLLVILSYNTLKTITVPNTIIQYKVNYIEFPQEAQGYISQDGYLSFPFKDFTIKSDKLLSQMVGAIGENFQPFTRLRRNVYSNAVFYDEGVPIFIDITVMSRADGSYSWRAKGYYIEFTFEQFAKNATYILEYQEFMNENDPTLQRPDSPDYNLPTVDGIEDIPPLLKAIFEAISNFFVYIGDSFEYFFQRLEYYLNYIKFYVQDYAILFKIN